MMVADSVPAGHTVSAVTKQRELKVSDHLTFSFVVNLSLKPIGWWCTHSEWSLPLLSKPSVNTIIDKPELYFCRYSKVCQIQNERLTITLLAAGSGSTFNAFEILCCLVFYRKYRIRLCCSLFSYISFLVTLTCLIFLNKIKFLNQFL